MRRLIFILLAMIGVSQAQTIQYIGAPTTTVISRGNFRSDSIFYLPKRSKAPTDTAALRYQISDSSLYAWTGSQWRKVGADADTLVYSTRAWRQKGIDSVAGLSRIGGSGTTNYVPKFTASSTIGNSNIFDFNNKIGIGTTSPNTDLHVYKSGGPAYIALTGGSSNNQGAAFVIYKSNNSFTLLDIGDKAAIVGGAPDTAAVFRAGSGVPLVFEPNAAEALRLNTNQTITATSLAGSGSRIVVADANGTLSASSALSGYVSGSGTTNYVPKFTASTTIGNSQIFDNGTNVGIGTASPSAKLTVVGAGAQTILNSGSAADARMEFHYNSGREGFISWDTDNLRLQADAGNYLTFFSNATERLRIFANGRVFVGASPTDAGYQLDINGTLRSVNGANFATTSGQVGIGKTSPSAKSKLDVEGNIDIADGSFYYYRNTVANTGTYGIYYSNTAPKYPIRLAVNADPTNNRFFEIGWHKNDNKDSTWNPTFSVNSYNAETFINTTTDAGDYKLQVSGNIYNTGSAVLAATSGNVGVNTASPVMPFQLNNYGGFDGNGNQLIIRNNVYYNTTNARSEPIQNGYQTQIEMENLDGKIRFSTSSASNNVGTAASLVERMRITNNSEVWINTTTDAGDYKLQVSGNIYNTGSLTTGAPSGGSIKPWKIGEAATVSPTSPNRTIRVEIDGTVYYLHAKTTND